MGDSFACQPSSFAPHARLRVVLPLVLATLAAAPIDAPGDDVGRVIKAPGGDDVGRVIDSRFVLEVAGAPLAELRVTSDGRRYVYEATHFLDEGPTERRREFDLSTLPAQPEVLALLRTPARGCRDVFEENAGALERLCVTRVERREVTGTLAGAPLVARYDTNGALAEIKVGSARWVAATSTVSPPPESPFAKGLAVADGPLRFEPAVAGARWLVPAPRGIGQPGEVGRARCLVLARAALVGNPRRRLAVGLVVERARAFPHAWVVEGDAALDPSIEAHDAALAHRQYVELPAARSGQLFLQLFDGALRLVPR
jgi:hypothetical protein